ncbi:hypothetical protein [Sandaracinus amylolyticus]|uniref:hypothetical protein n=1 Tax=Sandaracinus amylolyticus TaxID=927083 RepID=UPI001F3517AF|nr:hypothetical protein [Sandaracinus amylolyticus]UJR78174.1 Hypothetical protein I5071_2010 [Sandaracinus amylolyticus]
MRRALVSVLLAAIAAPAFAQSIAPDVTSLTGALALHGVIEGSRAHGCSQSFASTSHRAELALDVDARGVAALTIDHHTHETFGPSPGRYMREGGETTRTTEHVRVVMRGVATRTATGLDLALTSAERASVMWQGWGSLPLPVATTTVVSTTMRCAIARVDVLPSTGREGETPRAHAALECTFDAAPEPLDRYEPGPMMLGRGAGFVVRTDSPMWSHTPERSIRVAP